MANIDKVKICNMALANIGSTPVANINGMDPKSIALRNHYDAARIEALAAAPWSCATKWKTGVQVPSPMPPWSFAYSYPADALRVHEIQRTTANERTAAFKVTRNASGIGKQINTNRDEAVFVYSVDTENPAEFDLDFVDALAWLLASKIAMPITKNQKLQDGAFQKWTMLKAIASAADANQDEEETDTEPFYQSVR